MRKMKKITISEILEGKLPKGSLILVRWIDASDKKALLIEHESNPEMICKDWGLYLGCSGRKKKLILIGKDVVVTHNEWGATRIPIEMVEEVQLILPHTEMMNLIDEVKVLGRRVSLRRYELKEERHSVQIN